MQDVKCSVVCVTEQIQAQINRTQLVNYFLQVVSRVSAHFWYIFHEQFFFHSGKHCFSVPYILPWTMINDSDALQEMLQRVLVHWKHSYSF